MTHYFMATCDAPRSPKERLISYLLGAKFKRPAYGEDMRGRLAAAADFRHRHVLERHRLVPLGTGQDAADRRRLVAEPSLMRPRIEEFLRPTRSVTMRIGAKVVDNARRRSTG